MRLGKSPLSSLLAAVLTLVVMVSAAHAQRQQEIPLDTAQLQALMNPTLQTLRITAASTGGQMTIRLPNGQNLTRPIDIGEITVPAPDPFPGVVCTINPIRNDGAPVVSYQNGRVQLNMTLRPVNPGNVINTRWTSDSILLPDVPGISVNRILVNVSLALVQRGNAAGASDLQVRVDGDWTIPGIISNSTIREQINPAVASNIRAMLSNDVNLMVLLSTTQYLQARAHLTPVQLTGLRNEPTRAVFVVRDRAPEVPPITPTTTINPNTALNPNRNTPTLNTDVTIDPAAALAPNISLDDWAGMWIDGETTDRSHYICMIRREGDQVYLYAGEIAANGSGIYKKQWEHTAPQGAVLRPDGTTGILLLQLVRVAEGLRIRYNRSAYDNFAASTALLHRYVAPATTVKPNDEKRELTDPLHEPAPDPKITDTKSDPTIDPKIAAIEEEKRRATGDDSKRKQEEDALKNEDKNEGGISDGGKNDKSDTPPVEKKPEDKQPVNKVSGKSPDEKTPVEKTPADKKPTGNDKTAEGGTTQISATEGNKGQQLFNGIWRWKVTQVEKIQHPFDAGRTGWGVTVEFQNGASKQKTLSLFNTGGAGKPVIVDGNGNPVTLDEGDWQTGAYFRQMLPGQKYTFQIKFYYAFNEKPAETAEKLVYEFDTKNGLLRDQGVKYTVSDPSFRVFLK